MKKEKSPVASPAREVPDLPRDLELANDAAQLFANPEVQLSERLVRGLKQESASLKTFHLEACVLQGVALKGAIIEAAKWRDVRFTDCDLANAEIRVIVAHRIEFVGCRMTGLRLGKSEWRNLLFSGGDQRYAQCRFGVFQRSEFNECDFEDADFYGADLRGCVFSRCNLRNVEMSKARLTDADLRGSNVEGLRLGAEDIAGAIVDPVQALSFAHLLGIRIL